MATMAGRKVRKVVDFQRARGEKLSRKRLNKQFQDKFSSDVAEKILLGLQKTAIENIGAVEYAPFPYTINTVSVCVLAANPKRQYLLIQNISTNLLYVSINRLATANDIFLAASGGFWEPWRCPKGAIYLLASADSSQAVICEG